MEAFIPRTGLNRGSLVSRSRVIRRPRAPLVRMNSVWDTVLGLREAPPGLHDCLGPNTGCRLFTWWSAARGAKPASAGSARRSRRERRCYENTPGRIDKRGCCENSGLHRAHYSSAADRRAAVSSGARASARFYVAHECAAFGAGDANPVCDGYNQIPVCLSSPMPDNPMTPWNTP